MAAAESVPAVPHRVAGNLNDAWQAIVDLEERIVWLEEQVAKLSKK